MPLPGGKSELRSTRPNVVPLLVTWCLYLVVHLILCQLDPNESHSWPLDAPSGAYIWAKVSMTQRLTKCQADLTQYHCLSLDVSTRGTSELRWIRHNLVPLLATRYLYSGVQLTKHLHDPKAHYMSSWPEIVPLLSTRCLYQGGYIWVQVNQTQLSTTFGH